MGSEQEIQWVGFSRNQGLRKAKLPPFFPLLCFPLQTTLRLKVQHKKERIEQEESGGTVEVPKAGGRSDFENTCARVTNMSTPRNILRTSEGKQIHKPNARKKKKSNKL